VLRRENKWVLKSKDLERFFSIQREAVDAAIRSANDSGKEGKPGVVLVQKSKSEFVRRELLSAGQIGLAGDVGDGGAAKIGGDAGLDDELV
jgi:hypothetical protein